MKKFVLALSAIAAFTAPALAADMATKAPMRAAPAAYAPSWTGFYIFGGGGGGLWNADSNVNTFPGGLPITRDQRMGGSGWFGTVGAGYDWQFSSWVLGIFGDGQFGELRGSIADPDIGAEGIEGREKLRTSWAAGVRLGYLVAPNVLSYVNAGYSGSEWSGSSLSTLAAGGGPTVLTTPSFHRDGWFIGGGVENNLNIFGITAPGWFMKTEYRSAFYDRISLPETLVGGGSAGGAITFKPWVQTISTSLVYRFNWGGAPISAGY
jgi:outer membrane immunogenic protein